MQPKTKNKLDKKSFEILKNTMQNIVVANRKNSDPTFSTSLPREVAFKLTNKCNLRCKHCYQWNEEGYHKKMGKSYQNQEMDFDVIKNVIRDTRSIKSRLYLWGGEPFCHSRIDEILKLIHEDQRETIICTNAMLINKYIESLMKIENLEFLIAIEGFEKDHDAIRGKGSYKKVIDNIKLLLELREKGIFKGKITIHTVIHDHTINELYDLMEYLQSLGVDMVMLCFPWYISRETAQVMDCYYNSRFSWLKEINNDDVRSWHGFTYRLNPDNIAKLKEELKRINNSIWDMNIRYQPGLEFDEIEDFILGNEMKSQQHQKCLVLSTRVDIHPNNCISACKQFPEFEVGDLTKFSLKEIWNSDKYNKIRGIINTGLTPVCTKCNVLYLYAGDLQK